MRAVKGNLGRSLQEISMRNRKAACLSVLYYPCRIAWSSASVPFIVPLTRR